jgi:hypothetical protein
VKRGPVSLEYLAPMLGSADLGGGVLTGRGRFRPFVEEKPSQGAQVVEQTAARLQVLFQFVQLELHYLQSFHAAIRSGSDEVGCNLLFGFRDGLNQEAHVFVGVLNAVEWSFEGRAHGREYFNTSKVWRRGCDLSTSNNVVS